MRWGGCWGCCLGLPVQSGCSWLCRLWPCAGWPALPPFAARVGLPPSSLPCSWPPAPLPFSCRPSRSGTADQVLGASSWGTQALWFGVLALCAPLWEELMFRGFLLPSLARCLPRWAALGATSLLFALVHFSREGLLPLLLLGCVFGGAYAATRNLLAPVALHSLWNVWLLVQLLRSGAGAP